MTICCISDTHGQHEALDLTQYPADVLVHAGDWTRSSDRGFTETDAFLEWLEAQPYNYKVLIAGNHEVTVEEHNNYFNELLFNYPSITYLQDSATTIEGVNFYGSPSSNKFYNWAFMGTENELHKVWNKIPLDTNVLITHGPAYMTLDKVVNTYGRDPHVGSKSLQNRKCELTKLKLHITGHIHEGAGQSFEHGCINVNAAVLNERYNLVNEPIIITIN